MIVTIRTGESICRGFSDASFCVTLLVHFISLEDLDSRTMIYDFDTPIERRSTHSAKWNYYAEDVLPLWVADMDFPLAGAGGTGAASTRRSWHFRVSG